MKRKTNGFMSIGILAIAMLFGLFTIFGGAPVSAQDATDAPTELSSSASSLDVDMALEGAGDAEVLACVDQNCRASCKALSYCTGSCWNGRCECIGFCPPE